MARAPFITYEAIQPPQLDFDLYDSPLDISDWAEGVTSSGIPIVKKNPTPIELQSRMTMGYTPVEESQQQTHSSVGKGVVGDKKKAMDFFISKGLSAHAAAGIVGNLMHESSLNTGAVGDKNTSIGIAQWHLDRADKLKTFAKRRGTDWKDFDTQLEFLLHELNTDYSGVLSKLMSAKNSDQASDIFLEEFEKPKHPNQSRQKRRDNARSLLT